MIASIRVKRPQDPSLPEFDTEYTSHRLSWPPEIVRGRCQRSHTRLASTKLKGKWTEDQVAKGIDEEVFDRQNRQHPPGLGELSDKPQTDVQPFDEVSERNFDLRNPWNLLMVDIDNVSFGYGVAKLKEIIGSLYQRSLIFSGAFLPLLVNVGTNELRGSYEMWLHWNIPRWDFGRLDGTYTIDVKSCCNHQQFKCGVFWPQSLTV